MAPPPQVTPGFAQSIGSPVHFRSQPFARGVVFLGAPFSYADYPTPPLTYEPAPPQIVVVQAPAAAETLQENKPEPLLIEWQGDRYVRFGGGRETTGSGVTPDYAEAKRSAPLTRSPAFSESLPEAKAAELPPALLIYRDGHREEVSDYAIIGDTLYARGDYWRNGYWMKNIQLSAIDLVATMKANQENGVRFVLPSGPNEVVTRP